MYLNKKRIGNERIISAYTETINYASSFLGVHIFQGSGASYSTGAKFPTDINIFTTKKADVENWYIVTLETLKNSTEYADQLAIYKYHVSPPLLPFYYIHEIFLVCLYDFNRMQY